MNRDERQYAATAPDGKVFRQVSRGHEIHEYGFTDEPYLGFDSSCDVYGDGAVVVVLAGGHTTGSVIVFVTLPSGRRYAFIGDLTWHIDGIRRRVERPWPAAPGSPPHGRPGRTDADRPRARPRLLRRHPAAGPEAATRSSAFASP